MMAKVFLVALKAYTGSAETTLYFSEGPGFCSGSADTPASTYFDTRLVQPVSIARSLVAPASTFGRTRMAFGDLVLNNADGGLDSILSYGFDGRDLTVYLGDTTAAFPVGFEVVFSGTMEQVEYDHRTITIRVRDKQFETKKPVQATLYAGTNSLPAGVEGVADDLKGKPKPLTFGTVYNVQPRCVNTDRYIYQLHTGALQSIPNVYVNGVALSAGTAHASQAAMEGATVGAGAFDTWLGGGMFRLAANPDGTVTADAVEGANAAARTAAEIFERVLEYAGVPSAEIDDTALTALDTANSAEVGIYIAEPTPVADVLDEVCGSVGAWWGQSSAGLFTAERFAAPSGSAVAEYEEADLLRFERRTASETTAGLPVWRVVLGFQKNYTVQEGHALEASVTAARRGFLANEYRTVKDDDTSVQAAHPEAPTLEVNTLLISAAAAATEADRLQTLRGTLRDVWEVRVRLDDDDPWGVDLGDVVEITHSRFGLSAGKLFRVIGLEPDARRRFLNLTIWG